MLAVLILLLFPWLALRLVPWKAHQRLPIELPNLAHYLGCQPRIRHAGPPAAFLRALRA
jgi:hypothetical protein